MNSESGVVGCYVYYDSSAKSDSAKILLSAITIIQNTNIQCNITRM